MTSERSKRRDFLSLIFISKSIILCGQKIIHNGEVPLLHVASVDCVYKSYTCISIIIQVKLPKGINIIVSWKSLLHTSSRLSFSFTFWFGFYNGSSRHQGCNGVLCWTTQWWWAWKQIQRNVRNKNFPDQVEVFASNHSSSIHSHLLQ